MPKAIKEQKVSELAELLRRSQMAVITEYRGMTMVEIDALRSQLRKANAEFHVVKNTLTKRAGDAVGATVIEPALAGPTALAFCFGEVAEPAKVLMDFARTSKTFRIRSAYLQGALVPGDQLAAVAALPARPVIMAQFLGALQGPTASVVGVLSSPLQSFIAVLQARADQMAAA